MPHPTSHELNRCRVLIVGDAMLDCYWFGSVDRISPEAPVPVVRITRQEDRLGGAANVALNVKHLGAHAALMTVVGNDEASRALQRLLEHAGIDALLGRDDKLCTIVKLRVIGRSQQLLHADFERLPENEVLAAMLARFADALSDYDAVLFSDYGKGGLTHIARMIELARAAGKPVLVDPKGSDYSRYTGATVITPNRAEFAQVAGHSSDEGDLRRRAEVLRAELKLAALLLTRSEEGMTLFQADGSVLHVPAQAKEVFDVTGSRRHGHRHARRDGRLRHASDRSGTDRQPSRRHRRRQVWDVLRQPRGVVRVSLNAIAADGLTDGSSLTTSCAHTFLIVLPPSTSNPQEAFGRFYTVSYEGYRSEWP